MLVSSRKLLLSFCAFIILGLSDQEFKTSNDEDAAVLAASKAAATVIDAAKVVEVSRLVLLLLGFNVFPVRYGVHLFTSCS